MAELVASLARGAVDSLLGRLGSMSTDEARLLGGHVRRDVQFIKDEMEMMDAFLLLLLRQQAGSLDRHHHNQCTPWIKKATELAGDCRDCAEQYAHFVAARPPSRSLLLGHLRRVSRLVRSLPVRHRLAVQIQDIKVRLGELNRRRKTYDISVSPSSYRPPERDDAGDQEDEAAWRRHLASGEPPADLKNTVDELVRWLMEDQRAGLRIIPVVGICVDASWTIADRVYRHSSVTSMFDCKAWITVRDVQSPLQILRDILCQLALPLNKFRSEMIGWKEEELVHKFRCYLRGKIFLLVLHDVRDESIWSQIEHAFPDDSCAGSAIIITTGDDRVADSLSTYQIFNPDSSGYVLNFYLGKAIALLKHENEKSLRQILPCMLVHLEPEILFMKMLLRYLYYESHAMFRLRDALQHTSSLHDYWPKKMVFLCYNYLPDKYRSCMLYLSIFPPGYSIRRTSLVRRWVVEGLITDKQESSALEQADQCFDALVGRLILCPSDTDSLGKVRACTVPELVHDALTDLIARESNITPVDTVLVPPELARHLSIRFSMKMHMSPSEPINNILTFLKSLPSSSLLGLLKVLDLDGCKGLKRHHLKNICGIYLLKYLSLRGTDVTTLPKQIENLIYLETLDIRQTKISAFPGKSLVLPMLKHLFSGHTACPSKDIIRKQESFSTIHIPHQIGRMRNMEILSYVEVSHGRMELIDVNQLLKLRKLGVVMNDTDEDGFDHLIQVICRLHKCLRSLSIWIRPSSADHVSKALDMSMMDSTPLEFLESLAISGIKIGLPPWIEHLHQLTKVTLRDTSLTESAIHVLGKLVGLRYLRLRHRSYAHGDLAISGREFKSLQFLLIEDSDIVSIRFDEGAAPRLERMVWRFTIMNSLVGVGHLLSIRELQLEGDCNLDKIGVIQNDIKAHPNGPSLKHIPAAEN
ncbi:disease resistance protein Pik-2-like [Oryza brachyantha]|uniref:Rx N-terminal domain-containing protein n=1 Tax=Oryza brachyantha TaxID=4533 RepID=J3N9Y4_ORYBR|nr:disease resistance protein Pik-2-like [Oryza brachyantha]